MNQNIFDHIIKAPIKKMLNKTTVQELEGTVACLVKGGSDLTLMGGKSSGKTTLIKKLMHTLFEDHYLYINCTIIDSRDSFLFLFMFEFIEFLKKLDEQFMSRNDLFPDRYSEPGSIITLTQWIKDMNKVIKQSNKQFQKISRMHIVIDNIQQIKLSQNFMSQFYRACKQQISGLKFSMVFVGTNLYSRSFDLEKPFSIMPVFYMPKPDIKKIINAQIAEFNFGIQQTAALKKLKTHLETTIYSAFETIEDQYEKMKQITKIILQQTRKCHNKDPAFIKDWLKENSRDIFERIKKYGPVNYENIQQEEIDREQGREKLTKFQQQLKYQRYPNLILTSLFLANGHPETYDYKRFKDYKLKKKSRKDINVGKASHRKGEKNTRHNIQRIVAISEVLEHISKDPIKNQKVPYLMQKQLEHHSLDYYGCFEYLREQNQLSYYGKINRAFGGKVIGNFKQDHAKQFFRNITDGQLSINQFVQL